jgi:hypothetical protein
MCLEPGGLLYRVFAGKAQSERASGWRYCCTFVLACFSQSILSCQQQQQVLVGHV